jgi:ribosome-binding factor A
VKTIDRTLRVRGVLMGAVSEVVRDAVHDPHVAGVVFTRSEVARDMGSAKLWFLCPQTSDPQKVEHALNHAAGFIRSQLFGKLTMRRIPGLMFEYDRGFAEGAAMSLKLAPVTPTAVAELESDA